MLMGEVREVWMCISYVRQLEGSGFAGWGVLIIESQG